MKTELAPSVDSLEGKSPYELRLNQSVDVPESAVKKALETGDTGFLHSFTTGSTVDGPGVRVVAWTAGCQWRCRYCHNPDTWSMINGIPVTLKRAVSELRRYRTGLKLVGLYAMARTADAGPVCRQVFHGCAGDGTHRSGNQRPATPHDEELEDRSGVSGHRKSTVTLPERMSSRHSLSCAWRS
jgi:hypothetical protein